MTSAMTSASRLRFVSLTLLAVMMAGCGNDAIRYPEGGTAGSPMPVPPVSPPPALPPATTPPATTPPTVRADQTVHLMAFNDFHGNLEAPRRFVTAPDPADASKTINVPAGGVSYLADAVAKLRARYCADRTALISVGDMIGASPLLSSLFLDEPTIDVMNAMKLDMNVVGNHEFDKGTAELRRLAGGGCQVTTSMMPCQVNASYAGARFDFLAANVVSKADGKPIFPAYKVMKFGGIPVAFVGVVTKTTPSIVSAAGISDVVFRDEAETVNALIPELKRQGIEAIVVVMHEGANSSTTPLNSNTCLDSRGAPLTGNAMTIASRLDSSVDVILNGHTHQTYTCDYSTINPAKPFLITSASSYGVMLSDITLELNGRTGDVNRKSARQVIIQGEPYTSGTTTYALTGAYEQFSKTPAIEAILEPYRQKSVQVSNRPVGRATTSITRTATASGESALGNLIADAQLADTRANGAQFALMNPGGVRADLIPAADGTISYGQIFAVQPFGNGLVTLSLTGAQLKALLEQQWSGANAGFPRILLPSAGLTYSYRTSGTDRAFDIRVNGQPVSDAASYRFTVNSFLADGGDNFTVLRDGTNRVGGNLDVTAFESYLRANSPVSPAPTNRISKVQQ